MKRIIFSLVVVSIFFSPILYSYNPKIDFQTLYIDFKGVCSNSNAVVAYGDDFTNILISTDKGETWMQKMILSIFNNLNKLIVYTDIFYGIADSSIIVKSFDGFNWSSYYNPIGTKFIDISADSNFIYLLSSKRNKLFILDKNAQLVDSIDINSYVMEIYSFRNNLLLGTNEGKLIIFTSEFDSEPKILDLSGFGSNVYNFFSDESRVYFLVSNTLCSLDSSDSLAEVVLANAPGNCTIKNGEIYSLRNEITYLYGKPTKWVGCYRYNKNLKEFIKLNNDNLDRYIEHFESFLPSPKLNFTFIDNDKIILVGQNKTILISSDRGRTWRLRSFRVPGGTGAPFVLNNYIWQPVGRMILRSTDYGVTWIPQKADSLFIISLASNNGIGYIFFDSSGKGFIVNSLEFYYPDSSRNFEILYTDDFGENYQRGNNKRLFLLGTGSGSSPLNEIVKFKNNFILKRVSRNNLSNGKTPLSFLEFFDTNFTNTGALLLGDTVLYKIFFLDNPDTLYGYFWKGTFSDTAFYNYKDIKTWVGYTTDGVNWNKLFDTDINEFYYTVNATPKGIVGFQERYYDSTLEQVKIFFVDVKNRKTIVLLNKSVTREMRDFINEGLVFMYPIVRDKVFYSDFLDSIVYVCDLSNSNFPKWERTHIFDPLFNYFNDVGFHTFSSPSDSVFYFFLRTSKKLYSYLFRAIIQDTNITNVENDDSNNSAMLNKLFVQVLSPFPQPASNIVRAKIYIERFREIKPEYFKLYDLSGNAITYTIKTSVDKLSPFLFEATFDVSGLPNGIYFVRYTPIEEQFLFPIVIYR